MNSTSLHAAQSALFIQMLEIEFSIRWQKLSDALKIVQQHCRQCFQRKSRNNKQFGANVAFTVAFRMKPTRLHKTCAEGKKEKWIFYKNVAMPDVRSFRFIYTRNGQAVTHHKNININTNAQRRSDCLVNHEWMNEWMVDGCELKTMTKKSHRIENEAIDIV